MIEKIYRSLVFRYHHANRGKDLKKKLENLSNLNFKTEQQIFIFSDPRSGSTWLMEILNQLEKTATIWEPFHPNNGVIDQKFNLGWRPYVPEDYKWEELKDHLDEIFSNSIINKWTIDRSRYSQYKKADRLIVKMVRTNALLPFFVNQFQLKYKPIYLLRHPVSQGISHIKAFGKDKYIWAREKFEIPKVKFAEPYLLHKDFLMTLESQLECRVAQWCITNSQTLNSKYKDKWKTVFYENVLINPHDQLDLIFEDIGKVSPKILKSISAPSWTSSKDLKSSTRQQIEKWTQQINVEQKSKLQRIINHFNLSEVYNLDSAYPLNNELV